MENIKSEFLKLRQQIIKNHYNHLNPMQKTAVFNINGPTLVLAGAGSGKTTVLVNRIDNMLRFGNAYHSDKSKKEITPEDIKSLKEYLNDKSPSKEQRQYIEDLIAIDRVPAFNIIAITFTNKAASELKERLETILEKDAKYLWACTFHSACVRILRQNGYIAGIDKNFTIYDSDDQLRVIKACIKELNMDDKRILPKAVQSQISQAKNKLITCEDFEREHETNYYLNEISKVYKLYTQKLKTSGALDFDDLIMQTVRLLLNYPDVLNYYQNKFKYVLVDEYQDTNYAQYTLVSLFSQKHNNICVVGDDDQSIYKFRGATIENILNFEAQYENPLVIRLEQNYRSTKNILSAANSVIKNNFSRKEKSLWTDNSSGEKINVFEAQTDDEESRYITKAITDAIEKEKKRFSDFAVLYRMNAQSGPIERVFSRSGIPYKIIGGTKFYDRKEIRDMLAYLHLIVNTSDDLRLKRIINEPKRGIGQTTVTFLEAISTSLSKSMFETISMSNELEPLRGASKRLKGFYDLILSLKALQNQIPPDKLINEVFVKSGYYNGLIAQNTVESQGRIENVNQLVSNAVSYLKENPDGTLQDFLEDIALFTDLDTHDLNSDFVVLMTIHSSKGLEFDTVFLTGLDEGLFPSMMSINFESEIEEERRLCYVAITRAKRRLYITRANQRLVFGKTVFQQKSRFLKELPKTYVNASESKSAKALKKPLEKSDSYSDSYSIFAKNKKPARPRPHFIVGDCVEHKIFGRGMILTIKPMGNDLYLEIAFDKVGTKKLMANFANLKKL